MWHSNWNKFDLIYGTFLTTVLADYAHYREVGAGVDVDGLGYLAKLHANELVATLCDEKQVKDGLVHDINT